MSKSDIWLSNLPHEIATPSNDSSSPPIDSPDDKKSCNVAPNKKQKVNNVKSMEDDYDPDL